MLQNVWAIISQRLSAWLVALGLGIVSLWSAIAWWRSKKNPSPDDQELHQVLEQLGKREDSTVVLPESHPAVKRLREEAKKEASREQDEITQECQGIRDRIRGKFHPR